VKITEGFH